MLSCFLAFLLSCFLAFLLSSFLEVSSFLPSSLLFFYVLILFVLRNGFAAIFSRVPSEPLNSCDFLDLSRVRSRLYQRRFLQLNSYFAGCSNFVNFACFQNFSSISSNFTRGSGFCKTSSDFAKKL